MADTDSGGQSAAAAAAAAHTQQLVEEDASARVSLLDVVCKEYALNRSARTSRMLLVGEIDAEKIPLLQKFHADFLDALPSEAAAGGDGGAGGSGASAAGEPAKMTGALFVLHGAMPTPILLQLVEAPTHVLVDLLRNLSEASLWPHAHSAALKRSRAAAENPSSAASILAAGSAPPAQSFIPVDVRGGVPLLRNSKVLSFVEEVPREFHVWAFRSLRVSPSEEFPAGPAPNSDDKDSSSNPNGGLLVPIPHLDRDGLKLVFEVLRNLLELGRSVSATAEDKAVEYLQASVAKQLLGRLPPQEKLHAFLHQMHEDIPSIPEWLDIFDTPVELTLESEKVWPVEPFLKY
jgi:hypothetical protein